jgi:hypothetical protein
MSSGTMHPDRRERTQTFSTAMTGKVNADIAEEGAGAAYVLQ